MKTQSHNRVSSARGKTDPTIVKTRPRLEPQYVVVSRYRLRTGGWYNGVCANLFQSDSGHPSSGVLMGWRAAEYTKKILADRNPSAKYTIHKVGAALQKEPKL